uniref:TraR protein n=1 Tax=Pseudomonas phage Touem01 TaxID=3138548 RepID=A0AAU6W212_9VIRU
MSMEEQAQALELMEWEAINRSRPAPVKYQPGTHGYGPEFCRVDACGVEMPAARREWGFTICVGCKTLQEKAATHRRQ